MESGNCLRIAIWHEADIPNESYDLFVKYANLLQISTGINVKILDEVDIGINTQHPNGSWAGLLGMVNRGEADLALSDFDMTEDRLEAVDFLYPYMFGEYSFATKHPDYSPEMFALLYPFQFPIWITLALSLIFISGISFVALSKSYFLVNVVFHHFAAITGQTTKLIFPSMCCRLISLSWMFGMMILANCYKSVLLSFMTVPTMTGVSDFKELTEAVERGRYQCVVSKVSFLPYTLSHSDVKSFRILFDDIEGSPIGYGGLKVFLANSRENIVLIDSRTVISFLSRKFFVSSDRIFPMLHAHAVRKRFSRKRELDTAVLRISDTGLFKKLLDDYTFLTSLHVFSSQPNEDEVTVRILSLFEVSGIFIILICGHFVAAITLAIEIFYFKHY